MKEYYYLDGEAQLGPFQLDELKSKPLTDETYVWYEELDSWKKLKDLPELRLIIVNKRIPPPPPIRAQINKTEVSGTVQITKQKESNLVVDTLRPSRKGLSIFLIWTSIHLFALLTSYSEIDFFNGNGEPSTEKFWPFVDFTEGALTSKGREILDKTGSVGLYGEYYDKHAIFNGVFTEYDWSEFCVYVGGAFIIFVIGRISSNKSKTSS